MFLSFQMIFSLASAAIVWAALESTSLLEPSSHIMAPRYLMDESHKICTIPDLKCKKLTAGSWRIAQSIL